MSYRDLLWDFYRLSYRSIAPSLTSQLMFAIHSLNR